MFGPGLSHTPLLYLSTALILAEIHSLISLTCLPSASLGRMHVSREQGFHLSYSLL